MRPRVPLHQANRELYRAAGGQLTTLDTIRGIIADKKLTDNEKVRTIEALFSDKSRGDCSETKKKTPSHGERIHTNNQ